MNRFVKKILTILLTVILTSSMAVSSFAASLNVAYEAAATENYYLSSNVETNGEILSEYLALVYSGFTVLDDSYLQNKDGVELLAMEIITNAAEGKSPNDSKNAELVAAQKEDGSFGNLEETCLAMIALKTAKTVFSSEKAVNAVISNQNEDGLFGDSDDVKENIEMTALGITVLSPYVGAVNVQNAIDKAVNQLHAIQNEDGTFADGSSVTLGKVISALSDIGESPNSDVWKKLVEILVTYKNEDGSYKEYLTDTKASPEATAEALCTFHALASGSSPLRKLMTDGKLSSFNIKDILPFVILYGVILLGSIVFWVYALRKKQNKRTLEDAKKAYDLC